MASLTPIGLKALCDGRSGLRASRAWTAALALSVIGVALVPAGATELTGARTAALDQPQINLAFSRTPGGTPLTADIFGFETFNITAFFDTGASGILISNDTADLLEMQRATFNGSLVDFADVGVSGTDHFNVSEPLYVNLAPYHPNTDADNPSTYASTYTQIGGVVRTQIGPVPAPKDPSLQGLDVVGIPAMRNKVVVMDPKPVDTFADTMRTYVYDPGTPFDSAAADDNPGIPQTNRSVKLSKASFERFTTLNPSGAAAAGMAPTLNDNPFIGPDPTRTLDPNPAPDNTPPVQVTLGSRATEGSFLLDTGAAASLLSTHRAADLGVRYVAGTQGTETPVLESFDPANPSAPGTVLEDQYIQIVGGIGGISYIAGTFFDSLLLRTEQGIAADPNDPNHLRYNGAPLLIADITVADPLTSQTLTLDGIFGMNYLVANCDFDPLTLTFDNLTEGNFNWVTFDEGAGRLGLDLKGVPVPEPTSAGLLLLAGGFVLRRYRPSSRIAR